MRRVADSLETKCPVTIWQALNAEFGVSKAEERLTLMQKIRDISIQSNDYSQYLQKFRMLWRELRALKITIDDLEHDFFVIGLCDYQRQFVKTQLDTFYHEGRDRIKNIDLRQFQDALLARHRTFKDTKKDTFSTHGQAKVATLKPTDKKEKDYPKNNSGKTRYSQWKQYQCKYCDQDTHLEPRCWFKDPTQAPKDWIDRNKDKIQTLRRKHGRHDPNGDSYIQELIGNQPATGSKCRYSKHQRQQNV